MDSVSSELELLKIFIRDESGRVTVAPLVEPEITIGRDAHNGVHLPQRDISRHHARLFFKGDDIFIEDLSSYNGVKVNGRLISSVVTISPGDRIQIGGYVMWLDAEGTAPFNTATVRIEIKD